MGPEGRTREAPANQEPSRMARAGLEEKTRRARQTRRALACQEARDGAGESGGHGGSGDLGDHGLFPLGGHGGSGTSVALALGPATQAEDIYPPPPKKKIFLRKFPSGGHTGGAGS